MKILLLAAIPVLVASCAGNPAAIRAAEKQCSAQGVNPDNADFQACIHRETERIYKSWGRDSISRGD